MSPPGPPHPHPPRYRHGSGHSELEPEEGGPSVQYSGNYYGEPDIENQFDQTWIRLRAAGEIQAGEEEGAEQDSRHKMQV